MCPRGRPRGQGRPRGLYLRFIRLLLVESAEIALGKTLKFRWRTLKLDIGR